MKKLASDLTLPSDLVMIIIIGSLSFFLGGLLGGMLLLVSDWPWGFLLEGAIGGLLLGLFLRRRYALWMPTLAGMLSVTVAISLASLIGLLIELPYSIAMLVGGAFAGVVFGGILNARRALVVFILVCAIGFGLGQILLETLRSNFLPLYVWIGQFSGENGGRVFNFGLMGLYQGFSFSLALVLAVLLHRRQIEA